MKIDPDKCPQATAAKVACLSVRHFQRLKPPRNVDGTYSLVDVVRWRLQAVEDKALTEGDDAGGSPALERMRELRAEIYAIDLAERRGELWPAAEVRSNVAKAFEIAKRVLLAFPARMAPQIVGLPIEDAAQLLDGSVRDLLDELCENLKIEQPADAPAEGEITV